MQRRTVLSASFGLGALAGLASLGSIGDAFRHGDHALSGLSLHSGSCLAFGTTVTITVLHCDPLFAEAAIQQALREVGTVDALMSVHRESSQVFQLNRTGSIQSPDKHFLYVLSFAQQLSALTAGAFDITVQPLWQAFSRAGAEGTLPTPNEIAAARTLVDWRRIEIRKRQVRLQNPGMAITLNGVAQGYAVDLALQALRNAGVRHALLDTGEFGSIGGKQHDRPWTLGIADPRRHEALSARIKMDGRKVATSGDYATFFTPDFVHHHIFDPATGASPLDLASVTVVAPTGILADGLSTAFMVMGAEKALALAALWPEVDAMLIAKDGAITKTAGFPEVQA